MNNEQNVPLRVRLRKQLLSSVLVTFLSNPKVLTSTKVCTPGLSEALPIVCTDAHTSDLPAFELSCKLEMYSFKS